MKLEIDDKAYAAVRDAAFGVKEGSLPSITTFVLALADGITRTRGDEVTMLSTWKGVDLKNLPYSELLACRAWLSDRDAPEIRGTVSDLFEIDRLIKRFEDA